MTRSSSSISSSEEQDKQLIVQEGFGDIQDATNNPSGKLQWFCAPDSWNPSSGSREGQGGSWKVNDTNQLTVYPAAKKDFWRKTYYDPLLLKDDGPVLYYTLAACLDFYTVRTKFDLTAVCQFDQAGLCVRFDSDHWIKAGIEVVDGLPRLSVVVTNDYSDWSTQPWLHYTKQYTTIASTAKTGDDKDGDYDDDSVVQVRDMEIRIHCRGTSFVVEAKMPDWEFIRIAHLTMPLSSATFGIGVFACCPEDQRGGFAVFTEFEIRNGSQIEHNADRNH
mmetsp:Transcript_29540/g.48740  ORF Transcript_29540/g.48740 Transcript_29540/m.48740 type:complete len:277 (-) Transcript_29540:32-862(-)